MRHDDGGSTDGMGRTPVPSTNDGRARGKIASPRRGNSAAQPLRPQANKMPGDSGRPIHLSLERAPSRGPAGAEGEFWLKVSYAQGQFWYRGEAALWGLIQDLRAGRVRLHAVSTTNRRGRGGSNRSGG